MSDRHREIVQVKLEALGYKVEEIPEGKGPSADLAATGPDRGLVVEVKSRQDDLEKAREFYTGPTGRVMESTSPIAHDDFLSDVVHKAAKQIAASQEHFPGLGVLWFRSAPELGISYSDEEMLATLLGRRYVMVRGANGGISMSPCYLAAYADFYRYRAIDIAVVEDPEGKAKILINPYSTRLPDVRKSLLVKVVASASPGAIIDVRSLDMPKDGYVLWGDFSRKDEATALAELKKLFPERDFQFFDMKSVIGRIKVDT